MADPNTWRGQATGEAAVPRTVPQPIRPGFGKPGGDDYGGFDDPFTGKHKSFDPFNLFDPFGYLGDLGIDDPLAGLLGALGLGPGSVSAGSHLGAILGSTPWGAGIFGGTRGGGWGGLPPGMPDPATGGVFGTPREWVAGSGTTVQPGGSTSSDVSWDEMTNEDKCNVMELLDDDPVENYHEGCVAALNTLDAVKQNAGAIANAASQLAPYFWLLMFPDYDGSGVVFSPSAGLGGAGSLPDVTERTEKLTASEFQAMLKLFAFLFRTFGNYRGQWVHGPDEGIPSGADGGGTSGSAEYVLGGRSVPSEWTWGSSGSF